MLGGGGAGAASAGESAATYEQLEAVEEARADECETAYRQAWRDASRAEVWTWLG